MKHDIIQADVDNGKINFIFECKYFDSKGDVNKIEKVASEIKCPKKGSQKIIYFLSSCSPIEIQQA